ncbi:hypothetical protein KC19_3G199600 [Ceratodon purpureus]|uniref:DCD domain-containing protein n=1 Tax=Ceratodon purpureus TaxID=3225 RepID=A0A8T0IPC3_CERPU|nr:hypothetical protein KC19_3G199600 [Ceratodon purpureus]
MRIAPGAAIFLFNFRTKCMHGIFEATSHGGVHIIREAFGGKYEAQVSSLYPLFEILGGADM